MLVKVEAMRCLALSLVVQLFGVTQFLWKRHASRKPVEGTDFTQPSSTGAQRVLGSWLSAR